MKTSMDSKKNWFMAQIRRATHTLSSMEMRLNAVIQDRELNVPVDQIFANYNPFQLETVAVEICGLFMRHSILLAVYSSIAEWGLSKFPDLTPAERKEVHTLQDEVGYSRQTYIDGFGRAVVRAFHERLLVESRTKVEINDLETLMIRFFGTAYNDATGVVRLQNLLTELGDIVYRPQEAKALSIAADHIPYRTVSIEDIISGSKDISAMTKVMDSIDAKLDHLEKTLLRVIDERKLTEPEAQLFAKYKYTQIESIIVQVQYNFSRAALLLSCYEAELKFSALQNDMPKMCNAVKKRYAALFDRIADMRAKYVDGLGAALLNGLIRHLHVKGNLGTDDLHPVDNFLIKWFGVGMPAPGDTDCPAFHELVSLLNAMGLMSGLKSETDILVNCFKTTARLERKPPIR